MYDSTEILPEVPAAIQRWFRAVIHGNQSEIHQLHAQGIPVETIHPIRQTTALVEASRRGLESAVVTLLQLGASPDTLCGRRQTTAMHMAIRGQHFSLALQLLSSMKLFTQCDHAGNSYLHVLNEHYRRPEVHHETLRLAEALIAGGTPLNAINEEGVSALHYAVVHDWEAMAELLLMRGANVNITAAESGASALIMAALDDNLPLVRMLFSYHADPTIAMDCGRTALDILPRIIHEAPEAMQAEILELRAQQPKNPRKKSSA